MGRDFKVSLIPSSRLHAKSAHAGCRKQAAHELSLPEDQRQESWLLNSRFRHRRQGTWSSWTLFRAAGVSEAVSVPGISEGNVHIRILCSQIRNNWGIGTLNSFAPTVPWSRQTQD